MEEKHKQALQRCRSALSRAIKNPGPLLDRIIHDGFLCVGHEYEEIRSCRRHAELTEALLNLLPKLGAGAYRSFVSALERFYPDLAELVRQKELELEKRNVFGKVLEGEFPPRSPASAVALRVQKMLRKNYLQLARKVQTLDYCRTTRPMGLHDVYVTLSSLDFDEIQKMHRQNYSGKLTAAKRGDRQGLERRTFASRCGDSKELAVRRLLHCHDGQPADSCLVIGPGGVGKTLLLQWLMVSWAEGRAEELSEFELVIYVSGRDTTALESDTGVGVLQAALKLYDLKEAELKDLGEYLRGNSRHLLVLLDSADEGGQAWLNSKGLQMLLNRRSLQECSLIVTSRPCSLAYDLVQVCMLQYYAVGFSDAQLDKLLERRLSTAKGREVAELLKEEPRMQLRELMKGTPLLANMVAELAAEGVDGLPSTMTQTYAAISMNMVHRQRQKAASATTYRRKTTAASCIDDLPVDVRGMFACLGQMALEGLKKRHFVFDDDDVRQRCGELALEIGVLEEFEYFSVARGGVCCGVQFRHLSWQEWFAAYAVSLLSDKEHDEGILAYVRVLGVGEEMELFWRFAVGHAKGKLLQRLMETLRTAYANQGLLWNTTRWLMFACSCLAEAIWQLLRNNQSDVENLQAAATIALPEKMDIFGIMLSVAEAQTLSVAVDHAPHVLQLYLQSCGLCEEHFRVLGGTMARLQTVYMYDNPDLHGSGLAALAKSATQSAQLHSLSLDCCALDASDCMQLDKLLFALTSLTSLSLCSNRLGSVGVAKLKMYFVQSKLEWLLLGDNNLDGDAGCVLGFVVRNSKHLRRQSVADNNLGNTGVENIMEGLARSSSLEELDVSRTGVDHRLLTCMSAAITQRSQGQMVTGLTVCPLVIRLHDNCIGQEALQHFASQLPTRCKYRIESGSSVIEHGNFFERNYSGFFEKYTEDGCVGDLRIVYEGIDERGAIQASSLLNNGRYSVKVLDLGWNSVGNGGAAALANTLKVNTSLLGLSLTKNKIGLSGFTALVRSLTYNTSLLCLNLYGNPLFSSVPPAMHDEVQASLHSVVNNSRLCHIGLDSTGLGDAECAIVGDALSSHGCNLIFMDLANNEIGDKGAAAFCRGLERNATVKFVDLSKNQITSSGVKTLHRCLQLRREQGSALQRVWMDSNRSLTSKDMAECMVLGTWSYPSFSDFIEQYLQPH